MPNAAHAACFLMGVVAMKNMKPDILKFLQDRQDKEFESYQIAKALNMSKSTTNGYLVELENDSMVTRRQQGYYVFWRANVSQMPITVRALRKPWNGKLFN
jgi:predicted transcriptional regulator